MSFTRQVRNALVELGLASPRAMARAAVAATLCVMLVDAPLYAGPIPASAAPAASQAGQLQGQARVVHALNRFTFGPRPGEVAAVETMGLRQWFERQLTPGAIPDAALDARLAQFPAMQLPIQQLSERYPGPAIIRAMENGRVPLPSDATSRIVASDSIAFYQIQQARKAATAPAGQPDGANTQATATQPANSNGRRRQQQVAAGMNALDDAAQDSTMAAGQNKPLAASELSPELPGADAGNPAAPPNVFDHQAALAVLAQPPAQRYATILNMPPMDLVRFRQSLRQREQASIVAGMTPMQAETLIALGGGLRMVAAETTQSRLLRDIYSDRQLEAVMTDFWLNHFNVYMRKNQVEPYLIPTYERETIRPNALGNFEQLLVATAKSPAMLVYLDNWQSTGPNSQQAERMQQAKQRRPDGPLAKKASSGLNENYGRELMELHTLGVNGGYTQADVTSVARVFTGWTVDRPRQGGGGAFQFDDRRHEPGSKTVLGKTIQEGGMNEGLQVLHMLATSPATAHFICSELAVRFVSDDPPPALVDRMAQSFLASQGDIKTVLRTLFNSPEFWSPAVERTKVKTPLEFVASAARAGNVDVVSALGLVQSLDKLGMPLYGMQTPNGYSWKKDDWVSTGALVTRLNFALVMSGDRLPGVQTDWAALLAQEPSVRPVSYSDADKAANPRAAEERRLESVLLGGPVSERTRQTVLAQASDSTVAEQAETQFGLNGNAGGKGKGGGANGWAAAQQAMQVGARPPDNPQAAAMAGLLLGSPEFQRR